ncbi:MAG: extracellular solute-binding protein [Desulfurococcales archaeon]|nr:extracellular solute-binding protein [Desulfurococcales archaeon]
MVSRRDFLKIGGALALGGILGYFVGNQYPLTFKGSEKRQLRIYNWQAYINKDVVLPLFKGLYYDKSGSIIDIVYDEFNNADEAYAKLSIGGYLYDVYNLGIEVIYKALKNKYVIELVHNKISNMKNIDKWILESLKIKYPEEIDLSRFGIPYMWGTTGVVYNKSKIGVVDSLRKLFDLEFLQRYSKRIFIIDDPITATMIGLIYLGRDFTDPRSYTVESLSEVYEFFRKIVPHIVFLTTDQLIQELIRESVYAGVAWSGDALQAVVQNENLEYNVPIEGGDLWIDMWSIASNAKNIDLGYTWIDFTLDPWVAALNTTSIWYANPVSLSNEYIPEKILNNPAVYPDKDTRKRLKLFRPLTEEESRRISEIIWSRVAGV